MRCVCRIRDEKGPTEESVHYRHVESEQQADRLLDEKEEGSQQGRLHLDRQRRGEHGVQVVHGPVHLTSLGLKLGGTAAQQNWRVRLRVERAGEEHDEGELWVEA